MHQITIVDVSVIYFFGLSFKYQFLRYLLLLKHAIAILMVPKAIRIPIVIE